MSSMAASAQRRISSGEGSRSGFGGDGSDRWIIFGDSDVSYLIGRRRLASRSFRFDAEVVVAATPSLPAASTGKMPVGSTAKMAVLPVKVAAKASPLRW